MPEVKELVCVGTALLLHVGFAAVAVTARAPAAPKVHAVDGTSIEVDEIVPKHIETLDEPVEHVPEVVRQPMRGAPSVSASPIHVIAIASVSAPAEVPDPPPAQTAPPHFSGMSLGGSDGSQAIAPQHVARIFSESDVTERARLVVGPKPVYPATALADGIELDAPLAFEIVVDTNGAVISTRPLGVAGHGFDEAALSAVRAFRFTPAKRDGDLVRVRMRWTVEFHLKG